MLDRELEVGYTPVFPFFSFVLRDPLSPKAHYFPSSHPYASTFQSAHSSVSELILLLLLYIADF